MSLRSRRAAAPVSSSASTTIRPLTMCSPPANRSIEATSALRQQVLVIWVEASSAFTCAVIAMSGILPCWSTTLAPFASAFVDDEREGGRETVGIVPRLPRDGEVRNDQTGAPVGHCLLQLGAVASQRAGVD